MIGSGASGLTAAVALPQAGQKVLVCEQHDVSGGWTHSLTLNGYRFSPGVHYIGGIEHGGSLRKSLEDLGVSKDHAFCALYPDGYDHIVIGDKQYDFLKGKEKLAARLKEYFQHEAEGIDDYLDTAEKIVAALSGLGRAKGAVETAKAAGRATSILR